MAHIISVLNPKGGVGKTTISLNIASCLHAQGHRVLLVDSDKQGNLRSWADKRPDQYDLPMVVGADVEKSLVRVGELGGDFDYVIVDGVGHLELGIVSAAVKVANMVLIPIKPGAFEIDAIDPLVEAIKARQLLLDGRPSAHFVISMQRTGTRLSQEIDEALEDIGFPIFTARTSELVDFQESVKTGGSVHQYDPSSKAWKQIEAITNELKGILHGKAANVA